MRSASHSMLVSCCDALPVRAREAITENGRGPTDRRSQLSLVEVVDRAVGLAFTVAESEALIERASRGVALAGAKIHVIGTPVASKRHCCLHERPPESSAAPVGNDVELRQ